MKITVLTASDLEAALPMLDTVEAMKRAFADLSSGQVDQPRRVAIRGEEDGILLVKPAAQAGHGLGAKLVSVFPRNARAGRPLIHGLVALFDPATGEPVALLEGGFLTAWRTGAGSGAATDLLARRDATVAALIGSGIQAETQALALDAVRDLEEIRVFSRDPAAVERFVGAMAPRLRARAVPAASAEAAVAEAQIVVTATTSEEPVFDGSRLAPGCHVNGVGSFTPGTRELDAEAVGRAEIFVDCLDSAVAEAGDLLLAEREGRTRRSQWVELGEVAAGRHEGRTDPAQITLFKSVGVAVQDIAAGALALANAQDLGLGSTIEI